MKLLNEEDDGVSVWATEQENKIELYKVALQKFNTFFMDLKVQMENKERFKIDAAAEEKRRQALLLNVERFERKKQLEFQLQVEKLTRSQEEKSKAKLPKLEISKFDGTFVDLLRFWQQLGGRNR